MALPEYKNLTQSELEMADHYAEIGDMSTLRKFQEISANREEKTAVGTREYSLPMEPRRIK